MANPQLLEYIKAQLKNGIAKNDLLAAIRSAGWQEQAIQDAFWEIEKPVPPPLPKPGASMPGSMANLVRPAASATQSAPVIAATKPVAAVSPTISSVASPAASVSSPVSSPAVSIKPAAATATTSPLQQAVQRITAEAAQRPTQVISPTPQTITPSVRDNKPQTNLIQEKTAVAAPAQSSSPIHLSSLVRPAVPASQPKQDASFKSVPIASFSGGMKIPEKSTTSQPRPMNQLNVTSAPNAVSPAPIKTQPITPATQSIAPAAQPKPTVSSSDLDKVVITPFPVAKPALQPQPQPQKVSPTQTPQQISQPPSQLKPSATQPVVTKASMVLPPSTPGSVMLPTISTFPGASRRQMPVPKKSGHWGTIVTGILLALIVASGGWAYITKPPFAVDLYRQVRALVSGAAQKPAALTPVDVLAKMNAKLASMHNAGASFSFLIGTTTIADADFALSSDRPLIRLHSLAISGNISALIGKWIGFDSATGGALLPSQLAGIRSAIIKSNLFTVVQDMTDPQNALAPFEYRATLNKDALLSVSAQIASISGSTPSRESLASFKADLDASSLPNVTLWIDRTSYLPIKIELSGFLAANQPYSALVSVDQLGALEQGMASTTEEISSANALQIIKNALAPASIKAPVKKPAVKKPVKK